jgi:hypothetical protein
MRMLLHARIPYDEFNAAVRDGSVGSKMKQILEAIKAEAVYFTEYDGRKTSVFTPSSRRCWPGMGGFHPDPVLDSPGILPSHTL